MVVPRKQQTLMGTNNIKVVNTTCKMEEKNKNIVSIGARTDVTGVTGTSRVIPGGVETELKTKEGIVGDVQYYREDVIGRIGGGLGIDSNGK